MLLPETEYILILKINIYYHILSGLDNYKQKDHVWPDIFLQEISCD
jgi:hypothetical protein